MGALHVGCYNSWPPVTFELRASPVKGRGVAPALLCFVVVAVALIGVSQVALVLSRSCLLYQEDAFFIVRESIIVDIVSDNQ